MSRARLGLVGAGYWGKNLLRNLIACSECELVAVADGNPEAKTNLRYYPHIPFYNSLTDLLADKKLDGVVIATPPASHRDLAIQALEAGCHVLIEKPMAMSTSECDQILEVAKRKNLSVMVDHTYVYHAPVRFLNRAIGDGELGDLLYYDSSRVNLGGFQPTVNVVWDLAPHDLSILDEFTGGRLPSSVSAVGVKHFGSNVENMAYVTMNYDDGFIAHLHLNWAAPVKVRQVMLGGTKKMAIYDDNVPTEALRIYDKTVRLNNPSPKDFRINYRVGDMKAPAILQVEALAEMVREFSLAIQESRAPLTDGAAGKRIVQILETISKSMNSEGQPILLSANTKSIGAA